MIKPLSESMPAVMSRFKRVSLLLTLASTVVAWSGASLAAPPDAEEIVEKADRIRFPAYGFQLDVTVTTTAPGRKTALHKYRILSKGNEKTIVMTTAPAVERGQIMLMKGNDLWVFLPKVSQPVRLPLSKKLTGQVANGDLARANFAGDYDAELLRIETIDGDKFHVLELTAARKGVTYHRVLYWVNARNSRPLKAEFYTVSKRLLKRCYYTKFEKMGGAVRPTRLLMEDTLRTGERSIMDYATMKKRTLPDKVFTKRYLKKLQ